MTENRSRMLVLTIVAILGAVFFAPGLEAARDEPENQPDPAARKVPHVKWATPYAGGKVRALVISAEGDSWDVYELAMRMDLDWELFTTTNEWTFAPKLDYYKEGIELIGRKTRDLRALLDRDYDVIVFVGVAPYCLPPELHFKVLQKVAAGTGCVTFNSNRWNANWRAYPGVKQSKNTDLLRTAPATGFSILERPTPGKPTFDQRAMMYREVEYKRVPYVWQPVEEVRVGKGVIYSFLPGGANYFGGPALHPAKNQEPEEMGQAEYFFSLAAKIVLTAAGKAPKLHITGIGADGQIYAPRAAIPFRIGIESAAPFAGEAELLVRTHRGEVLYKADRKVSLKAGKDAFDVAATSLQAGRYFVDVWLRQDGKVAEWASGHFVVRAPKAAVADLTLSKISYRRGEPLVATVTLKDAPAGATVRAQVRDAFDRILLKADEIPINGTRALVRIPLERTREIYHTLEVFLVSGGTDLDTRQTHFYVPHTQPDDFIVYTDGDCRNLNGMRRYEVFREYGVNLIEVHADPRETIASGFDIGYRYWLTHCNQMTGGCLSSPSYHKGLRRTFADRARLYGPFGLKFFSTGDDSGVAGDFCECFPNWVRPAITKLAEKYAGQRYPDGRLDFNKFYTDHDLGRMGEFWRFMWRANLPMMTGMKLLPGDFELFKEAWKETYGDVAAFNRASGTSFKSFDEIKPEDLKKVTYIKPGVLGFQDWLAKRYRTVAKLNATWGSSLKGFGDVKPALIEKLMGAGKYAAKLDKITYLEDLFISNMASASAGAHETLPDCGIGQGAASFTNIIPEVLRHLDTSVPYQSDLPLELIRSMPHRFCGHTIGVYGGKAVKLAYREYQPWHVLFSGGNFVWFWSMCTGGLMGDLSMNPARSGVMLENIREMQGGTASLLLRGRRLDDGIAILHSRASGHASGVLKEMGTMGASELAFQTLVEDLGMQYRYVSTMDVEAGALRRGAFKVLCLPYCQILTPKELAEIGRFARAGGTVIADLRAGTMDTAGRLQRPSPADRLFGVARASDAARIAQGDLMEGQKTIAPNLKTDASVSAAGAVAKANVGAAPCIFVHTVGKGRAILLNHTLTSYATLLNRDQEAALRALYRGLFADAGATRRFAALQGARDVPGVEMAIFRNGPMEFLTIEKHSYEYEHYPIPATIRLGATRHVYDVRAGKSLGATDHIALRLKGLGMYVFALLPYEVTGLDLAAPATVARGADAHIAATLKTTGAAPGRHVIRIDVYRPDGRRLWPMYKLETHAAGATLTLPIAFNDAPGTWRVVATDVVSGLKKEAGIQVE